ncbi:MAG: hypothetical protein CBC88_02995 [Candidatus Pelagibacter sp. TMED128]|nr:MAG: hypothetical protein CBC88_02995 [Candidatus Pelagibacter sp. TMED128]
MRSFFLFFFILISLDFIFSQLFLLDILYKKELLTFKNDITYRVPDKEFKYSLKKNSKFETRYNYGSSYIDYTIHTNNLGFRDSTVRNLNKNKNYSILIGDSFVEGVALEYKDSLVGLLNQKLGPESFEKFEFLNAGVASYSPYLYKRKIETIINDNKWLKVNSVIILYDKSDIGDNLQYLNRPSSFPTIQKEYKNPKKEKLITDLKNFKFGSILTEQTMIGIVYRRILGDSVEKLLKNLKFRRDLSKQNSNSFFQIEKEKINAMYAIDQYDWLQKYFYEDLWETEGKRSIDFAFETFKELKFFLDKRNIKLYVLVYPWPFDLKDNIVRKKYLDYLNLKFSENNLNNLIIYDEFLKGDIDQNIFKYYLPKDVHFNREGNLILKNKIYKTLLKDSIINDKRK